PIRNRQLASLAYIDAGRGIPDGSGAGHGGAGDAEGSGVKSTDCTGAGFQAASIRNHEISLGCVGAGNIESAIEAQQRTVTADFELPPASTVADGDRLCEVGFGHAHHAAIDDGHLARTALGAERNHVLQRPACAARDDDASSPFRIADVSAVADRKSTRLNSSHVKTSYAVFCLKK